MKVSVVMPVYNGGERMSRTIDSVLAQTYGDFEFLCIDDGATDEISAKILDEYAAKDSRVVVVRRENKGVCETLNECYLRASGDYVARTDQDDVFHPQLLEYCVKAVEAHALDFLSFRYERLAKKGIPDFSDRLSGTEGLVAWNESMKRARPLEYCEALTRVHTDTWSHFLRRELAVRHPFNWEMGLTRVFAQLKDTINWSSSEDVLYYYDAGVATSMTHQKFSVEELLWDMADILNTTALYDAEIKAGDPFGEWAAVWRGFVVKYLKINYNKIRHSKGLVAEAVRDEMYRQFAKVLHLLFREKGLSMKPVMFKHQLAYAWLMFKYRKDAVGSENV